MIERHCPFCGARETGQDHDSGCPNGGDPTGSRKRELNATLAAEYARIDREAAARRPVMAKVKAGETTRFDCEGCGREVEVTLEPKAAGRPKEAAGIPAAEVRHCPFCGHKVEIEED